MARWPTFTFRRCEVAEQATAPHHDLLVMAKPCSAWTEELGDGAVSAPRRGGAMRETLAGVPDGLAPLVLARLTEAEGAGTPPLLLHVARDDRRLEALAEGLAFFAPKVRVIQMPAWDTVPYDRIGPNAEIVATRVAAMARLAAVARKGPTVVLTTVNSILQRLPPREFIRRSLKTIAPGQRIDMNQLVQRLNLAGFQRTGTVMEAGEYAVRGGILDLFPPGRLAPRAPRLLRRHAGAHQGVRSRDAAHRQDRAAAHPDADQRGGVRRARPRSASAASTWRRSARDHGRGRALRGRQRRPALSRHGALAAAVPRPPGDAVRLRAATRPSASTTWPSRRWSERLALIADHYEARVKGLETLTFGAPPYKPVPAAAMFLDEQGVGRAPGRPHRAPHDAVRGGDSSFPRSGGEQRDAGRRTRAGASEAGFPVSAAVGGKGPDGQEGRVLSFGGRVGAQFRARARRRGRQRVRRRGPARAQPAGPGQAGDRRRLLARRARAPAGAARRASARQRAQGRELRGGRGAARRRSRHSRCSASSRASRRPTSPSSASRTSWATGWCGPGARRAALPTSSPRRPAWASAISSCTPTTASAASTASPPSPRWARRTTAWRSPTRKAPSSICRSRTSSCCRATARPTGRCSSTAWAASPGRRARRASSSASARSPPS